MILAPHADDAELAAFGLYSAHSANTSIVTLTQGEIEADHYHRLGLTKEEAARLKGRLRAWDSLAIPLWGGVNSSAVCSWGITAFSYHRCESSQNTHLGRGNLVR